MPALPPLPRNRKLDEVSDDHLDQIIKLGEHPVTSKPDLKVLKSNRIKLEPLNHTPSEPLVSRAISKQNDDIYYQDPTRLVELQPDPFKEKLHDEIQELSDLSEVRDMEEEMGHWSL